MTCNRCGNEQSPRNDSRFCSYCGSELYPRQTSTHEPGRGPWWEELENTPRPAKPVTPFAGVDFDDAVFKSRPPVPPRPAAPTDDDTLTLRAVPLTATPVAASVPPTTDASTAPRDDANVAAPTLVEVPAAAGELASEPPAVASLDIAPPASIADQLADSAGPMSEMAAPSTSAIDQALDQALDQAVEQAIEAPEVDRAVVPPEPAATPEGAATTEPEPASSDPAGPGADPELEPESEAPTRPSALRPASPVGGDVTVIDVALVERPVAPETVVERPAILRNPAASPALTPAAAPVQPRADEAETPRPRRTDDLGGVVVIRVTPEDAPDAPRAPVPSPPSVPADGPSSTSDAPTAGGATLTGTWGSTLDDLAGPMSFRAALEPLASTITDVTTAGPSVPGAVKPKASTAADDWDNFGEDDRDRADFQSLFRARFGRAATGFSADRPLDLARPAIAFEMQQKARNRLAPPRQSTPDKAEAPAQERTSAAAHTPPATPQHAKAAPTVVAPVAPRPQLGEQATPPAQQPSAAAAVPARPPAVTPPATPAVAASAMAAGQSPTAATTQEPATPTAQAPKAATTAGSRSALAKAPLLVAPNPLDDLDDLDDLEDPPTPPFGRPVPVLPKADDKVPPATPARTPTPAAPSSHALEAAWFIDNGDALDLGLSVAPKAPTNTSDRGPAGR